MSLWIAAILQEAVDHDEQLVGTSQNPRCLKCHRLIRVAPHRGAWPNVRHHPRCPTATVKHENAASDPVVSIQSRKRRAAPEPGESPAPATPTALTHRITALKPPSPDKKQYNTRRKEQIKRLLDETHARRMAARAAADAGSACLLTNDAGIAI